MEAEKLTEFVVEATADAINKALKKQCDMLNDLILKELKPYGINALNIGEYVSIGRLTLIEYRDDSCRGAVYNHFYLEIGRASCRERV